MILNQYYDELESLYKEYDKILINNLNYMENILDGIEGDGTDYSDSS